MSVWVRYLCAMRMWLVILFGFTFPLQLSAQTIEVMDTTFASLEELWQQFEGKVVYVDFWASWCRPCLEEVPASNQLQAEWEAEDDMVFLMLGYNDQRDRWRQAIDEHRITGTHYFLTPEQSRAARRLFGITAIPHYALINRKGKIEYVQTVGPDYPNLSDDFRTLLYP